MATRRCLHQLVRHLSSLVSSNPSLHYLKPHPRLPLPLKTLKPNPYISTTIYSHLSQCRPFSNKSDNEKSDVESGSESDGGEGGEIVPRSNIKREYSVEEKEAEAAAIGYKVIGPLQKSDQVFKPYEPVFAVVEIGSHQFKVSNGDSIYTERLKFCEVNDKLTLNKVLMMGSKAQTLIGRPMLPDAAVHAVVEEHALDAKVIIFKKKRRKNYRRTKGHRQELTKLRIIDIQGIAKPEMPEIIKPLKAAPKKSEKVAIPA